jgi:molybdenum cofactor biosynthesis enzyme MoaA
MCHYSNPHGEMSRQGSFTRGEIDRLAQMFLPRALHLVIGCGAEPTRYPDFPELVRLGKSYGVPYIGLTTNGQLLTRDHLEQLSDLGLDELTVSVHGVRRDTYESFMRNASFERLHRTLSLLDSVKAERGSALPRLRIDYTVNPDNLLELSEFFDVFGDHRIGALRIRPIVDAGGEYRNCDLTPMISQYDDTVRQLALTCRQRNILLLANELRPQSAGPTVEGVFLDLVYRRLAPDGVWRADFDWRAESYDRYCTRTGWNRNLLHSVLLSRAEVLRRSTCKCNLDFAIRI